MSQKMQFSLSSGVSVLHSFKKEQRYWAIGQTVTGHFHFNPKNELYTWLTYYGNGKFTNQLTATAKSPSTLPQQLPYTNRANMRFKHISAGWKRYLKGTSNADKKWNFYGYAGLGLMLGRIENIHSVAIDSGAYLVPVLPGNANFKRLTVDLGLGYEVQLGGDIYLYFEGRTIIPTTDYPSNHILINKYAPLTASANLGFRILFE